MGATESNSDGVLDPQSVFSQLAAFEETDIYVSSIVSGGHIFVQQPYHPTFPALERLERCMQNIYERLPVPKLPKEQISFGIICVAKFDTKWFRLQVSDVQGRSARSYNRVVRLLCFG